MAAGIVTLKSCNEEEKENNHSEEFSSRLNDEGFDGCQDVIIVMVAVVDVIVFAVAVVLVVVTLI